MTAHHGFITDAPMISLGCIHSVPLLFILFPQTKVLPVIKFDRRSNYYNRSQLYLFILFIFSETAQHSSISKSLRPIYATFIYINMYVPNDTAFILSLTLAWLLRNTSTTGQYRVQTSPPSFSVSDNSEHGDSGGEHDNVLS